MFGWSQILLPLIYWRHTLRLDLGSFWSYLCSRLFLNRFLSFHPQSSSFVSPSCLSYTHGIICRWQRNIIQTFMYWQVCFISFSMYVCVYRCWSSCSGSIVMHSEFILLLLPPLNKWIFNHAYERLQVRLVRVEQYFQPEPIKWWWVGLGWVLKIIT